MVFIIIKLSTLEQDDDGYKLLQMYVFCHYLIKILHLYPYSFRLISLYDYSLLIYVCLPRKCSSVAASFINHFIFLLLLVCVYFFFFFCLLISKTVVEAVLKQVYYNNIWNHQPKWKMKNMEILENTTNVMFIVLWDFLLLSLQIPG